MDNSSIKEMLLKARKIRSGKEQYFLTDDICKEMLRIADEASINTYPDSENGYSVSVLTKAGNIYSGISYKSATYTLTMHSEAVALAHAAVHGEKEIVAITGPNCHICKQLIYESSLHSGIDVMVVIEEEGKIKQIPISEM